MVGNKEDLLQIQLFNKRGMMNLSVYCVSDTVQGPNMKSPAAS